MVNNKDFDEHDIREALDKLTQEYEQEKAKPKDSRNEKMLRDLLFARLFQTMKLSVTGYPNDYLA